MLGADQIGFFIAVIGIAVEAEPVAVQIPDISVLQINVIQAHVGCAADLIDLTLGQLHKASGCNLGIGEIAAVFVGNTAAGDAVFYIGMLVAGTLGHILGIYQRSGHPTLTSGIVAASCRSNLAGIQTHGNADHIILFVVQLDIFQSLVQRLHDLLPQHCGRILDATDCDDLLGLVITGPYGAGVVAGIAAEPTIAEAGGRTVKRKMGKKPIIWRTASAGLCAAGSLLLILSIRASAYSAQVQRRHLPQSLPGSSFSTISVYWGMILSEYLPAAQATIRLVITESSKMPPTITAKNTVR